MSEIAPEISSENCFGNYNGDDILCSDCEIAVECYEKTKSKEE